MRNFLEMYYEEEVYPHQRELQDDSRYRERLAQRAACEEALRAVLDANGIHTLNDLTDALTCIWEMVCEHNFYVGFRLGLTAPWS